MLRIKLVNDFHNTECEIRSLDGEHLSRRSLQRAHKELCGLHDCQCGGLHRCHPELGQLLETVKYDTWFDRVKITEDLLERDGAEIL